MADSVAARMRSWRARNPDAAHAADLREDARRTERYRTDPAYRARILEYHKARHQRRRAAGISVHTLVSEAQFVAMLAAQDGRCAICRLPETAKDPSGRVKRLAVDHDAITGRIRGLLCARCNTAIGLLRHDPDRVEAAVTYLRRGADATRADSG